MRLSLENLSQSLNVWADKKTRGNLLYDAKIAEMFKIQFLDINFLLFIIILIIVDLDLD